MDHREFDNYLTLLASLLQIRGEQRAVIAQELRAHLEDRLDDLLARGIDRDTAVQMALAEFGDAAGLAANFSLLVRNRRRRWMMKVTSFSTAVLVLLTLGLIAIWPEHRPGPAPQRAVAQAPQAGDGEATSKSQPAVGAGEGVLADKLARRVTAEFVETPLTDVLNFLAETSDVQLFVNRKAIENDGLSLDTPITIHLKNVRLDMLLDLVLEQAASDGGLTYVERDGILIVSTMSNLEGASEVRVYNCRDLLSMEAPRHDEKAARAVPGAPGMPPGFAPSAAGAATTIPSGKPAVMGGGMVGGFGGGLGGEEQAPLSEAQQRAESLKTLLQTAVKPNSWSEVGGIGTISEYNGLIVINHDAKTHKQVENVLKMLREAAGLEPGKTAKIPKQ